MKKYTYLKLIVIIALFAAVSATALSMRKTRRTMPATTSANITFPRVPYRVADTSSIARLDSILQTLEPGGNDLSMEGTAELYDPLNNAHEQTSEAFVFAKRGNQYFYRFGEEESINSDSRFVTVNHQTKSVFSGAAKKIVGLNFINRALLQKGINEGGFYLTVNRTDDAEVFTLSSDTNPSCRRYQVTFDKARKMVSSINTAIPGDIPSDPARDRKVDIRFVSIKPSADLSKYPQVNDIVDVQGKLHGRFTEYKLIRL